MKKIFGLLAALCLVTLGSCFSPWNGGEGTITIAFGSSGPDGRSVATTEEIAGFTHRITLTGPDGITENHSFTGPGQLTVAVAPGIWTIDIRALENTQEEEEPAEQILRAAGFGQAVVQAGSNATASIAMARATKVSNHAQLLGAISRAGDGVEKIIFITEDIIAGGTYTIPANANITLASDESVRIGRIMLHGGIMFNVAGEDSTLTLGRYGMTNQITIDGIRQVEVGMVVTGSIMRVSGGARLVMNDGITLTGNLGANTVRGGAVHVGVNGSFAMYGGVISNNQAGHGGGVYVFGAAAEFRKTGGVIYGYGAASDLANTTIGTGGRGNAVALPIGTVDIYTDMYTFDETVRRTPANPLVWLGDVDAANPPVPQYDVSVTVTVGQLRDWPNNAGDIEIAETVSLLVPGRITVDGSFGGIKWLIGENEIPEDSLEGEGATLILDSRVHYNEMRRHRVTVVVEIEGRTYSRGFAFTVGL